MNQGFDDKHGMDWEATTWEGHRRRQLAHWAELSLDEILEAQEDMADLCAEIAAAPVLSGKPTTGKVF